MMTTEEREKVRAAVAKAEAGLRAEIVPCVFEQSSPYPESIWAGAGAGMSLAVGILFLLDVFHPLWAPLSRLILWVPAAGLIGAVLGRWWRPARRALIGHRRMEAAVARRAKEVFFDRGVARTAAREGVLIYASLLERRVIVLADEAVRLKTSPDAWDAAVAAMTSLAAQGRIAEGLCAAVGEVARALHRSGFSGEPLSGGRLDDEPIEEDGR